VATRRRAGHSRSAEKVRLELRAQVPKKIAKSVLVALLPELRGTVRLGREGDCILINAQGLTINDARALLNSNLRLLKTAIESISAIK
jgi:tRNA threonylcarbamoyladenosine modification (KEOPS) complex  Pcc1 subunit